MEENKLNNNSKESGPAKENNKETPDPVAQKGEESDHQNENVKKPSEKPSRLACAELEHIRNLHLRCHGQDKRLEMLEKHLSMLHVISSRMIDRETSMTHAKADCAFTGLLMLLFILLITFAVIMVQIIKLSAK